MRHLAECRDHAGLVAAIRARLDELEVVPETIDHLAGLPLRYLSKIIAPMAYKSISSMSLGPLLQALGLKLIVVEDGETLDKIKSRLVKRKPGGPKHADGLQLTFSKRFMRKIARKGGQARMQKAGAEGRREFAIMGASARWAKKGKHAG